MDLEKLNNIQKVESPPYLFTRIEQKIADIYEASFSPRWTWTMVAAFMLLGFINAVISPASESKASETESLVVQMNIETDYNIYK